MRYILSRTKEEGVGQKGRRRMDGVGGEGSRSHFPRTLGTNIFQSQQLTYTHIGTLVWSALALDLGSHGEASSTINAGLGMESISSPLIH